MPGTITSDQLVVSVCDAAYGAPWASVGSFTTGPSEVDDYRIEGTFCYRGRLSASVRGWAMCAMPVADKVWQWDVSVPAYVDITTAFGNATVTDTTPFPATEDVGDRIAIGWKVPFGGLSIIASTLGTVGVVKWRYLNSAGTWTDLTGVTDNTTSFKTAGTNTVLWAMPTDWGKVAVNGSAKLFWVCAEVTTVYTINPVFSQGLLMYAPSNLEYSCFGWINCAAPPSSDTWANGGTRLCVTSDLTMGLDAGTWPTKGPDNSKQWYVNGSDGLRQSGYIPYVWNPDSTGSLTLDSPVLTRIQRIGLGVGSVATMATGNYNFFWDRFSIGTGLTITDGTSGSPADFASVFAADHTSAAMYGVITQASGIYYLGAKLYMGDADQAALSYFKDSDKVLVWRNFPVQTTFNEIRVVGNASYSSTFQLGAYASGLASGGCTIRGAARVNAADPAPTTSVWTLNGSDAYAVVNLYGSAFSELYRASLNAASAVRYCTFKNCGDISPIGSTLDNCTFQDLATTAPISGTYAVQVLTTVSYLTNCTFINCAPAVYWHVATDTNGYLDGSTFISGGTGHGLVLGTNTPSSLTLVGVTFTGYGGTPGDNGTPSSGSTDACIYNNSGKALTINISGGTMPSVRNGASATTDFVATVSVTFTGMKDNTEVRVYDSGTGVEIDGIDPATAGTTNNRSFTWSDSAGNVVDYVIHNVTYETIRVNSYTVPSSATSLPIQQRIDRNYENP